MNFKLSASNAAAVAVGVTSILTATTSVDAAQLTGVVTIQSNGLPRPNITETAINFGGGTVTQATESFTTLLAENPTIADITGLGFPRTAIGPINSFIDFGSVDIDGETKPLVFDLTSATAGTRTVGSDIFYSSLDVTGAFRFGAEVIGEGVLFAQHINSNGTWTIDLEAKPVPTPALLPGLLGLGFGVLKKRQDGVEIAK